LYELLGEDYVRNVAPNGLAHADLSEAKQGDPRYQELWEKLNRLGWQRKTKPAEERGDIDAVAFVSDEEYEALLAEARALPKIWRKMWPDERP
jgi:hypothetical protein